MKYTEANIRYVLMEMRELEEKLTFLVNMETESPEEQLLKALREFKHKLEAYDESR